MKKKSAPTSNQYVYAADRDELLRRFGKPFRDALHKAVVAISCQHPYDERIPTFGQTNVQADGSHTQLEGFRCNQCGAYVLGPLEVVGASK